MIYSHEHVFFGYVIGDMRCALEFLSVLNIGCLYFLGCYRACRGPTVPMKDGVASLLLFLLRVRRRVEVLLRNARDLVHWLVTVGISSS